MTSYLSSLNEIGPHMIDFLVYLSLVPNKCRGTLSTVYSYKYIRFDNILYTDV